MAWTDDDIQKLQAAIRSGVKTVRYSDRTVEYQDLKAMRELLAEMRSQVSGGVRSRVAATKKGFY